MLLPFYLCDTESCGFAVSRPVQLEFTARVISYYSCLPLIVFVKCHSNYDICFQRDFCQAWRLVIRH